MSAARGTVFLTLDSVSQAGNGSAIGASVAIDRNHARARYFGPRQRLFGIFDEPQTDADVARGVVLCHPHGADYDSAFRSFRILGARLARAGFHVLRFDYGGTGDSLGDGNDASIAQLVGDTVAAVHELRTSRQLRDVSIVGLRLGAAIAALAASESGGVEDVVLWEPVIEGAAYVASLQALHRTWLAAEQRKGRASLAADDDLLGYQLTPALRRDLEALRLASISTLPAQRIHVVNQSSSAEIDRLTERLEALGGRVHASHVEGPTIWSRTPLMPEASIPNRAIQAVVTSLGGAAR